MGFLIHNDRLTVEVSNPGEYAGSRFDWTGFIRQVTLSAGHHTFCTSESLVPGQGSGGIGLCNEFGIHDPIGYDEAKPGESFPKLGTGLLTRPDEKPYNFYQPVPVKPFPVQTDIGPDKVRFVSEPLPCSGYAVRLDKEITLQGASIRINYKLTNTGSKTIETNEYVHNFLAIDGGRIGPDYVLRFPEPFTLREEPSVSTREMLAFADSEIRWRRQVEGKDTFYCRMLGDAAKTLPYYWELRHAGTGAGVREKGSSPASSMALWGESHVVSPEVFVDVRAEPGQTQAWTREFEFFTE